MNDFYEFAGLFIGGITAVCSFLFFIYKELRDIRIHYVPHVTCKERMGTMQKDINRLKERKHHA